MIDMEKAMDRGEYLNPKIADQHPRFEMKTVRTWEYDEHWLVSATGRQACPMPVLRPSLRQL